MDRRQRKTFRFTAAAMFSWMFLTKTRTHKKPDMTEFLKYDYAHRGLHKRETKEPATIEVPENSMGAFRAAVLGGYGIELDVHLLRDGSVAVFHDANLKRMCGVDRQIETLDKEELSQYVLHDTKEHIPLLTEVLQCVEGKVPLIIEVKPELENGEKLCERLSELLDAYQGSFMIQSFDPRILLWCRRNRNQWVRGQLSEFFKAHGHPHLSFLSDFALRNMLANALVRPDYIAYNYKDRKGLTLRMCKLLFGAVEANWTIRDQAVYDEVKSEGAIAIFEHFEPRK